MRKLQANWRSGGLQQLCELRETDGPWSLALPCDTVNG